jgi:pSer/pThr/pTyr-binding forkhead associated (FHA) protein
MKSPPTSKEKAPKARLIWRVPKGEEQVRLLVGDTIKIGRSRDCSISVVDTKMSRHHAEIRYDDQDFIAVDLESANGTFVNGQRIRRSCRLKNGDALRLGGIQFRFECLAEEIPQRATLVVPELSAAPRVEVASGPQEGAIFQLNKEKTVIGRAGRRQLWDIMLSDRAVSRPHAEIVVQEKMCVLTDLGSANGTFVNGELVGEATILKDGDAITVGETRLVFRCGAP